MDGVETEAPIVDRNIFEALRDIQDADEDHEAASRHSSDDETSGSRNEGSKPADEEHFPTLPSSAPKKTPFVHSKVLLNDLKIVQALRQHCTVLGTGPPMLRVNTMSRMSPFSPEWQASMFANTKIVDPPPKFFQEYREAVADDGCKVLDLVSATDDLCQDFENIMRDEFANTVEAYMQSIDASWQYDKTEFKSTQMKIFNTAFEYQRAEIKGYFDRAHKEFHVKVAGLLADLSPSACHMLSQWSMQHTEDRIMEEIMNRNRGTDPLEHQQLLRYSVAVKGEKI